MKISTIPVVFALWIPFLVTAQSVEQQVKKLEIQYADAGVKKMSLCSTGYWPTISLKPIPMGSSTPREKKWLP